MPNLAYNLINSARRVPDRVAAITDRATMTYRQLEDASARLSTMLWRNGIRPGDRVGVMLPNIAAVPVVNYGIWRLGAIAVPMNPLLQAPEVEFYLANTRAKALLGSIDFSAAATAGARETGCRLWLLDDDELNRQIAALPRYGDPARSFDDDTAVVLHTSGTTGRPKGAELTHGNLSSNVDVILRTLLPLDEGDVMLACLPLFHVFGMTGAMNTAIAAGAGLSLIERFSPDTALTRIQRDRATVLTAVPTMFSAMLTVTEEYGPHFTATLRACISGGAALPAKVLHDFEDAFETVILEGYGLSETSPAVTFNHSRAHRKVGSIGTPVEGVRLRLIDEAGRDVPLGTPGELLVSGANVMKGYWNQPEATAAAIVDGWFHTGDIAVLADDGFYTIVDRKKDLIIRGGYNVYPREVEDALHHHPAIAQVAVVGIPDEFLGEEIGAAVVLKAGASFDPDELRQFVKGRVAAYKYPRRIWQVDRLPVGSTGKILRSEVEPPATEDD